MRVFQDQSEIFYESVSKSKRNLKKKKTFYSLKMIKNSNVNLLKEIESKNGEKPNTKFNIKNQKPNHQTSL